MAGLLVPGSQCSVPIPAARGDPIAVFRLIKAGDQSAPVLDPQLCRIHQTMFVPYIINTL